MIAGKEKSRTILCGIDRKYSGEKSNNMQLGGSSRLHMCWEATRGPGHYGHLLVDGERSDLSQTDEYSAVAVDTSWRECTQLGSSSAVHVVHFPGWAECTLLRWIFKTSQVLGPHTGNKGGNLPGQYGHLLDGDLSTPL